MPNQIKLLPAVVITAVVTAWACALTSSGTGLAVPTNVVTGSDFASSEWSRAVSLFPFTDASDEQFLTGDGLKGSPGCGYVNDGSVPVGGWIRALSGAAAGTVGVLYPNPGRSMFSNLQAIPFYISARWRVETETTAQTTLTFSVVDSASTGTQFQLNLGVVGGTVFGVTTFNGTTGQRFDSTVPIDLDVPHTLAIWSDATTIHFEIDHVPIAGADTPTTMFTPAQAATWELRANNGTEDAVRQASVDDVFFAYARQ